MRRHLRGLAAASAVLLAHTAAADEILSYLNLSSKDKLHSQVGLFLGHEGISVKADVVVEGQNGSTRVLPRVTSTFSSLEWLDVKSVLQYGDWNAEGEASRPTLDTRVSLRSGVPFIKRIEGRVQQTAEQVNQSLRFGFADLGLQALGGGTLTTDLTLQSAETGTSSKLTSSLAIGEAFDIRTVLGFADASSYDTKVVYRSAVPFIRQLEGAVGRTAEGDLRQSLGVRFPEISRGDGIGTPFTVRSAATLEETAEPDGLDVLRMGFETQLAGFRSALLGGQSKLSVKVERRLDAEHESRTSLAYDHAWAPRDEASIALNLKMLREQGDVDPTVGVSWKTRF